MSRQKIEVDCVDGYQFKVGHDDSSSCSEDDWSMTIYDETREELMYSVTHAITNRASSWPRANECRMALCTYIEYLGLKFELTANALPKEDSERFWSDLTDSELYKTLRDRQDKRERAMEAKAKKLNKKNDEQQEKEELARLKKKYGGKG